jgi:hypothetical protein
LHSICSLDDHAPFVAGWLIRPDGYVGFRCHVGDEAELVNYLQRHYRIDVRV